MDLGRLLEMDAIRKKMDSLKSETNAAINRVQVLEAMTEKDNRKAENSSDLIREMQRKCHLVEANYDQTLEKFKQTMLKLEQKEAALHLVEEESNAMSRRVALLQDEQKKTMTKLSQAVLELAKMSIHADQLMKKIKSLEQRSIQDEEATEQLEIPTREAKRMGLDSENKLEEMTRRLGIMEEELRRTDERAKIAEENIQELESELKAVGESMIALEVSEEKAVGRQEKYQLQIHHLMDKLKEAEGRYEYGEMNITKLHHRIEDLEDEICREKQRIKGVTDDLDEVLESMITKY